MVKREELQHPNAPDDAFRPIPDGGLSASMPDWLRHPPDWSLPHEGSRIPVPDRSPIDPRTLVREEDLPHWLVAISRRGIQLDALPEPEPSHAVQIDSEPEVVVAEVDSRPEWVVRMAGEAAPTAEPEKDAAVRREWATGAFVEDAGGTTRSRDPMQIALIVVAIAIIVFAIYLLT